MSGSPCNQFQICQRRKRKVITLKAHFNRGAQRTHLGKVRVLFSRCRRSSVSNTISVSFFIAVTAGLQIGVTSTKKSGTRRLNQSTKRPEITPGLASPAAAHRRTGDLGRTSSRGLPLRELRRVQGVMNLIPPRLTTLRDRELCSKSQ